MSGDCSFTDYTGSWVERVNRGGLFLVSNDFYIFIRNIEFKVRKILNVSFLISYTFFYKHEGKFTPAWNMLSVLRISG